MQTLGQTPFRTDREDLEQLIRRAVGKNVVCRVEEKWVDRYGQPKKTRVHGGTAERRIPEDNASDGTL